MTADTALEHKWLHGLAPAIERPINTNIMRSLKRFSGHNKLKKAALGIIADQLTEKEIGELRESFAKIDTDGNGVITISEMVAAVTNLGHGMLEEEVQELMSGIDLDGDGKVVCYLCKLVYVILTKLQNRIILSLSPRR